MFLGDHLHFAAQPRLQRPLGRGKDNLFPKAGHAAFVDSTFFEAHGKIIAGTPDKHEQIRRKRNNKREEPAGPNARHELYVKIAIGADSHAVEGAGFMHTFVNAAVFRNVPGTS